MADEDWQNGATQALMLRLDGKGINERDERGRHIFDDTLLIGINGSNRSVSFTLPKTEQDKPWTLVLNTWEATPRPGETVESEGYCELIERSMAFFRAPSRPEDLADAEALQTRRLDLSARERV